MTRRQNGAKLAHNREFVEQRKDGLVHLPNFDPPLQAAIIRKTSLWHNTPKVDF